MKTRVPGGLVTIAFLLVVSRQLQAQRPTAEQIIDHVIERARLQAEQLGAYTATRQYVVRNHHLKEPEVVVVRWRVHTGGDSYEVLSTHGPGGIARKSVMRMLDQEADLTRRHPNPGSINQDHYRFELTGEQNDRFQVRLIPRKKSKYLLNSQISIMKADWAIVRVEGTTASRSSFWVGKSHVVREYHKYGEFWLPSKMEIKSHIRLVGDADVTIASEKYDLSPTIGSLP